MSVYFTGIGAMRQQTVQRAVASIKIWCNLYGSHTVVFTIKQPIFGGQYLDRMAQTLKEMKDMFIIKCSFSHLVKKVNLTSTFVYRATYKIFKNGTQFLLSQKAPHSLASQSGLPPYKVCSSQLKLSTVLANQVILANT
jgi:hypothetical protein